MGNGLRDRVAANVRQPGTEVDTTGEKKPATLAEEVEKWQQEFQLAMPRGMEAQTLVRDALHLMRTTRNLAACSRESVVGGLMTFAQLGLRPGVLGHGWLIPFKTRKQINGKWTDVYVASVVIGYKGYVELGHRAPQVRRIFGRAVHERDHFHIEYGIDEKLEHRPASDAQGRPLADRGPVIGYYAVIKLENADPLFWYMTRDEVIEWRNRYSTSVKRDFKTKQLVLDEDGNAQGDGPWFEMDGPPGGTPFDQQAIKTCFLRAARWMPKQVDADLARAVEVDGAVRLTTPGTGKAPDPDDMLTAEHPVIDVEPEPDEAPEPPPVVNVGRAAPAAGKPAPAAALQTEFPPVAGSGTDDPASPGLLGSIGRMVGDGGITDERVRKAVVSRIAGLPRPVDSTSKLTAPEARQVLQHLSQWENAGVLAEQLAAVAAAAAPPDEEPAAGQKLPRIGTKAWHTDRHPRLEGDRVVRVAIELNGDCGICEEDAGTGIR